MWYIPCNWQRKRVEARNLGKHLSIYLTFQTLKIQLKTGELKFKALKWIYKQLFYAVNC